jgi:hypothetical protein
VNELFKIGDRFYSTWNGDVFTLLKPYPEWSELAWKIRWAKYDFERRDHESHDGLVTVACLERAELGRHPIIRVHNDKHLLELKLKYA